jgi:nicotinamide-nucleotide amidase
MRIEAIAIGTELLTTRRTDTNSVWIAERLAGLGLAFQRKTCIGDDREGLAMLCREALSRSDLIVCTGGLGPTFDDFTKEVWAEVLAAELQEDPAIRADILDFYARRGRPAPAINMKQALVPAGAEALRNVLGTAPGIWWQPAPCPGRTIVLLPGVPREMKHLWESAVEPRLQSDSQAPLHTLRMVVGGVPESLLDERTTPLRERHRNLDWTILSALTQVELVARSHDPEALDDACRDFQAFLGPDLVCIGQDSLEESLLALLRARGQTLAVAESMTGGLISARLTAIPGSSKVLSGGAVVYSALAKSVLAGVPTALIATEGTVSDAVTRALAEGIRTRLESSWGLAVTGNAGPEPDPQGGSTPVGTFFIAVAGPGGTTCERFAFPADRAGVQLRCAGWALDLLRRRLLAE